MTTYTYTNGENPIYREHVEDLTRFEDRILSYLVKGVSEHPHAQRYNTLALHAVLAIAPAPSAVLAHVKTLILCASRRIECGDRYNARSMVNLAIDNMRDVHP